MSSRHRFVCNTLNIKHDFEYMGAQKVLRFGSGKIQIGARELLELSAELSNGQLDGIFPKRPNLIYYLQNISLYGTKKVVLMHLNNIHIHGASMI